MKRLKLLSKNFSNKNKINRINAVKFTSRALLSLSRSLSLSPFSSEESYLLEEMWFRGKFYLSQMKDIPKFNNICYHLNSNFVSTSLFEKKKTCNADTVRKNEVIA